MIGLICQGRLLFGVVIVVFDRLVLLLFLFFLFLLLLLLVPFIFLRLLLRRRLSDHLSRCCRIGQVSHGRWGHQRRQPPEQGRTVIVGRGHATPGRQVHHGSSGRPHLTSAVCYRFFVIMTIVFLLCGLFFVLALTIVCVLGVVRLLPVRRQNDTLKAALALHVIRRGAHVQGSTRRCAAPPTPAVLRRCCRRSCRLRRRRVGR